MWAFDTETFLIFPGYLAPEMVCTTWAHGQGSGLLHHGDPGLGPFVADRLAHEHIAFANAPFDLAVFGAKWPWLIPAIFDALDEDRIHDVLTREKLLDLARGTFRFEEDEDGKIKAKGYSLAEVTWRRLGVKLEKDEFRLNYHDRWNKPLDQWPKGARDYAVNDAIFTLKDFEVQEKLRETLKASVGMDVLGDACAQGRAHWALHLMSAWGFKTDHASVERLEGRVKEEIEEIRDALVEHGLIRPDGTRDTKAAVRRMVEVMGDESVLTTAGVKLILEEDTPREKVLDIARDKGRYVSVSEDAAMLSGDQVLLDYSKYTRLRNLLTGSVKHLKTGTITPIQSRFEVLMETGRTSSSGPNIQNLRRAPGVRECFVPREGKVIVACDYSAAELHTLAQVCFDLFGKSAMGDAMNEGVDVHLWVASLLAGIPYKEAESLLDAGDHHIAELRQLAKAANFGFPGGCSAKRFVGIAHSYGVPIDVRDAAKLRALWFSTWPEMRLYFDHVQECDDGRGFYWVKQDRVERLRSQCTYTSACNSYFQGLAADGAKAALYAVTKEQFTQPRGPNGKKPTDLWGTACLAFVHDEILIEAPEARAHEAAMRLKFVMEREFNKFVPDCPTKAEPTIMRYWSKKAKPVWEDGRLVPWEGEQAAWAREEQGKEQRT